MEHGFLHCVLQKEIYLIGCLQPVIGFTPNFGIDRWDHYAIPNTSFSAFSPRSARFSTPFETMMQKFRPTIAGRSTSGAMTLATERALQFLGDKDTEALRKYVMPQYASGAAAALYL